MNTLRRSYVAGHTGMVGSALERRLKGSTCGGRWIDGSSGCDLRRPALARHAISNADPTCVYLAAARVGGIGDNTANPVGFLLDNLRIGANVIEASFQHGITDLLNFGSSCIYPRDAPQPLREEYLLTGALEPTNEAYALAKIATLKLADYYRVAFDTRYYSVMPTNLYGVGDRYHTERSHVIPSMILKFEQARRAGQAVVELWGSGRPLREFLFVDDLADAAVLVMEDYDGAHGGWLNVGSGEEISIADLAELVAKVTGYTGTISWDTSRPDGTPRKLLDSSKIRELGWSPKIKLEEGLEIAVEDYRRRHP